MSTCGGTGCWIGLVAGPDIAHRFSGPGNDIGNRPEQNQPATSENGYFSSHGSLLGRMPAGLEYRTWLRKNL